MSFGCLPCNILCTNLAPCRTAAGPSAPNDIRPPISANARVDEAIGRRYLIAISARDLITKLPWTMRASARSFIMVVNALSSSSGPRIITTGCISVPVGPPARRASSSMAFANTGSLALPNIPTRRTDGIMSRNSSMFFAFDAEHQRHAGNVSARTRQAGNDAGLDWVGRDGYDWDIPCCLLRRQRTGHIERNDHIHFEPDQFGRKSGKPICFPSAERNSNTMFCPST